MRFLTVSFLLVVSSLAAFGFNLSSDNELTFEKLPTHTASASPEK